MGKRTDFERIERDFYPTPYEAVVPLLKHLPPDGCTFDEPCAGDGSLIGHLSKHGHDCSLMTDINPSALHIIKQDAFDVTECLGDCFITNPPWLWKTLDQIISHFSSISETWLLLNADLMHNKRMARHMEYCAKILSVGRVSWMGNGKKGFENCAWYLFDSKNGAVERTTFYGR